MTYTEPLLSVFLTIAFVGILHLRRGKRLWVVIVGLAGLFAISWPPLNWLFSRPLEARYPVRPFQASAEAQAIVVLGSAIEPPDYERPYPLADRYTYERCEHAAWIYERRPLPVLACEGGTRGAVSSAPSRMRLQLERAGIPANMIQVEGASTSTYENALYGARILRNQEISRIILIVEADSMPRASACFRRQGMVVEPAPCEFRQWDGWSQEWLPSWTAIRDNELILHEVLGMIWYRLRGWI